MFSVTACPPLRGYHLLHIVLKFCFEQVPDWVKRKFCLRATATASSLFNNGKFPDWWMVCGYPGTVGYGPRPTTSTLHQRSVPWVLGSTAGDYHNNLHNDVGSKIPPAQDTLSLNSFIRLVMAFHAVLLVMLSHAQFHI